MTELVELALEPVYTQPTYAHATPKSVVTLLTP